MWKTDGVGPFRDPKDFGFYSEIGSHWTVLNRRVTRSNMHFNHFYMLKMG